MKKDQTPAAELPTKYLTREKITALQESIGFLNDYRRPIDEIHEIRMEDKVTVDQEATDMLAELGRINRRRQEIIILLTAKQS